MVGEQLSKNDFLQGSEAYIRYCAGIAILHTPERMHSIHNQDEIGENAAAIVTAAESFMVRGARRIIKLAQTEGFGELREVRGRFEEAYPGMQKLVEFACDHHEARLNKLNESFTTLRPAAFLRKGVYSKVCSSNYYKLTAANLMDGFVPDERLFAQSRVEGLTLPDVISD